MYLVRQKKVRFNTNFFVTNITTVYLYNRDPSCINLSNIIGFILNVPTEYKLGFLTLPLRRRHWISIRGLEGQFWNLDSKFDSPVLIGNDDKLYEYMRNQFSSNDKELFIVVSKEIEDDESWINKSE